MTLKAYTIINGVSTPVDMQGRQLKDIEDVRKWLFEEAPLRPDLRGLRIDVIDEEDP